MVSQTKDMRKKSKQKPHARVSYLESKPESLRSSETSDGKKKKTENGTRDEVQVCFGLTVVGTL